MYGWSAKLKQSPRGDTTFRRYQAHLNEILADPTFAVPRSLVHGDLINRNVHVADGKVTGLFDWGCSMYGDALYELAWFQFWAPWHPNIDVTLLEAELERRWDAASAVMSDRQRRLTACYLYIGLGHLAYNAHLEDWGEVAAVEERLDTLIS